jgi:N-acetylglucosamine-6-sulfatase
MKRTSKLLTGLAALVVAVPTVGVLNQQSEARAAGTSIAPAIAAADLTPASLASGTKRPNVLLVMTDDMRHDDVKYMPHVRQFIQSRGTDFRNMFAPTPLCCPNRTSYLTGKYAHNHKVWWHDAPWGYGAFDDRKSLGTALQSAGYQTGYVGKYLNGYGRMRPKAAPDHNPATFVPNGWTDWRATPDSTPLPESDPRAGSTYRYFDTTVNNNGRLEGHEGVYNSKVLANEGIKVLDRFTRSSKPWYLQINSLAPHHGGPVERDDPYLVTPARPNWVKGKFNSVITRGPGVPASGQPEPDVSDKARITRMRPKLGDRERRAIRAEARQRAETLYVLDLQLARVFAKLKASGQLANTIVAFTSDNGYMEGEHRWQNGKVIGFEPSYRVPLLIAGPGIPRGDSQYSPVTTVDLSATVLDWAGAHLTGADGRSFASDIGARRGWTQAVGYESFIPNIRNEHDVTGFTHGPRSAIGIRTAGYFYVKYSNGEVELFDLARDPNELRSVAKDPTYAAARRALDKAWNSFRDCAGDECRVTLDPSLQTSYGATRTLRSTMATAAKRYYG